MEVRCVRNGLEPGQRSTMSNSQTAEEVGGEVTLSRPGLPETGGSPSLWEPLMPSQDDLPLPQPYLRLPHSHPSFRADFQGRGCPYYGAQWGFVSRGAPPPRNSTYTPPDGVGYPSRGRTSLDQRALEEGSIVPDSETTITVDPELLEAAKKRIESYREDGPQIGFVFDEVPVPGVSSNTQQDSSHMIGEVRKPVTACRPPAFGAPWGFMYPPILPPVAHALASHHHTRMWGGSDGRGQPFFGYGHPARAAANAGLFGISNRGTSDREAGVEGGSPSVKPLENHSSNQPQGHNNKNNQKQEHPLLLALKAPNKTNEDSDLEMRNLIAEKLSTMSDEEQTKIMELEQSGQRLSEVLGIELPEFPKISPYDHNGVFAQIVAKGVLGDLLMVWGTLHAFGDMLGLWPCAINDLAAAILKGRASKLLAEVHIGLLRLLIADMEEAHISGTEKVVPHIERATMSSAQTLEEAWAWGFDVDIWRAHLNSVTWPEILRQFAIAAGMGPARPKPKREARPKIGSKGEDMVEDADGAGLNLRMPARFSIGSVKAAAWMVLAEAGPEGLTVQEIARQIQKKGLRDLSTSKTPEASVVGGLSRDMVFCRVAPATYALQSVISHHQQLLTSTRTQQKDQSPCILSQNPHGMQYTPCPTTSAQTIGGENKHHVTGNSQRAGGQRSESSDLDLGATCGENQVEKDVSCADASTEAKGSADEKSGGVDSTQKRSITQMEKDSHGKICEVAWIRKLLTEEYDSLSICERMDALCTLCNMATDGPSVRARLDMKMDQNQRNKKQSQEDLQSAQSQVADVKSPGESRPGTTVMKSNSGHGKDDETNNKVHVRKDKERKCSWPAEVSMRQEPLGCDRRHNRYWLFKSGPHDCCWQLFLESAENGTVQMIHHPLQLDELKECLEPGGAREGLLLKRLGPVEESIREGMTEAHGEILEGRQHGMKRRRTEDGWTDSSPSMEWADSIQPLAAEFKQRHSRSEAPAGLCHSNGDDGQSQGTVDMQLLSKLKTDLQLVEAAIPDEGFVEAGKWSCWEWKSQVHCARCPKELKHCLGELEASIAQDRISPGFQKKRPAIVAGVWSPSSHDSSSRTHGLDWLPSTLPSLYLRMLALDAAITYQEGVAPGRESLHAYNYIQRPLAPELVNPNSSGPPAGGMLLLGAPAAVRGELHKSSIPPQLPNV